MADKHPELAKQWHPTKNGDLTPKDVTWRHSGKVWWIYPYDDPITGMHYDFEWQTTVGSRLRARGCPYLSGKAVWPGFNDLASRVPDLAKEWHPTKNGALRAADVTCGSGKKVWWYLPYDDPETGVHFGFEWQATIASRRGGKGCPFLSGRTAWPGFNDLVTKAPDLAKEWHPTKNKSKPTEVTCYSNKKVWWHLPYDDPETGLHFDFEWQAKVCDRANGNGCPYLSGKAVWPGFNDLASKAPDLAKEWHPIKNGALKPTEVTYCSGEKVWWFLPYDDPETDRHFDFAWEESVDHRIRGRGCPFLSGRAVWLGFNDLATKSPLLTKEWHPKKNGDLKPVDVTCNSDKKVWWYLPYDDPKTGRHFEFEWLAVIKHRYNDGSGCPFLSGRTVWPGFNDLVTKAPDLAKEWHPTKNTIKPTEVTCCSNKKVWWYLPYDDPETGLHFDFEWEAVITSRFNDCGCPFLSGRSAWPGFNDLATKAPDLAREWHPTKNDVLPTAVTLGSKKEVWWYLPYDDPETGLHFDFEWQAKVCDRINGNGCPYLAGREVWPGFNDLASKAPDLAMEWHPIKNGALKPTEVTCCSGEKVWWFLPYDDPQTGMHFDFEWMSTVANRFKGRGCPFLSGKAVWPGYNDLYSRYPNVAKEWHPTKNRKLTPGRVYMYDRRKRWWCCAKCGHEWRTSVFSRTNRESKCRNCEQEQYTPA